MDPMIALCAGALVSANISLAFLEPALTNWMEDNSEWGDIDAAKAGDVWFWGFPPHVAGVVCTVMLMRRFPGGTWAIAAAGLATEAISCLIVPFSPSYTVLLMPISLLCFGIALIDTSLLPLLGYLVDTRHVSVYGSVYAIADMSYSLAYALGPVFGGKILERYGFTALNIFIFVVNIAYVPMFWLLRRVRDWYLCLGTCFASFRSTSTIHSLKRTQVVMRKTNMQH